MKIHYSVAPIVFLGLLINSVSAISATSALPTLTCPAVNHIVENQNHYWGTVDGEFRSFDISFTSQLESFLGAQWQGVNLGRIACVYKPGHSELFLVTLLYYDLAYTPKGGRWQQTKQGFYNCVSTNPKDCVFQIRPKTQPTNVYQDALQLRTEANPYDTPSF